MGGFQNPGVCLQAFPSFLPLHSSPCNSLLPNCTETLATQARLPISASSCSVSRYLGHGFQNRWLGDRSITTKSLSTVGRHRSICSMQIYHIFHSEESSCVFLFFFWRYIIFFASCHFRQHRPTVSTGELEVGCTTELRYVTLALKSTVLLRSAEIYRAMLALKSTVLLSEFSAEKHCFAGQKWDCQNV